MNNELELRLECMKLAVAITPTLNIPIQDRITENFNFILNKVTDNKDITFDSLREKRSEETMANIIGLISIAEEFIAAFKTEKEEEEVSLPENKIKEEEVKLSKKKVTQPKTEIKEETV